MRFMDVSLPLLIIDFSEKYAQRKIKIGTQNLNTWAIKDIVMLLKSKVEIVTGMRDEPWIYTTEKIANTFNKSADAFLLSKSFGNSRLIFIEISNS